MGHCPFQAKLLSPRWWKLWPLLFCLQLPLSSTPPLVQVLITTQSLPWGTEHRCICKHETRPVSPYACCLSPHVQAVLLDQNCMISLPPRPCSKESSAVKLLSISRCCYWSRIICMTDSQMLKIKAYGTVSSGNLSSIRGESTKNKEQ